MSRRSKLEHLPTFVDIYRDGVMVELMMNMPSLSLRSVIGKRDKMYKIGKSIIKELVEALVHLKAKKLRVYNIDPQKIRITPDG